jgi:hypothetical protein
MLSVCPSQFVASDVSDSITRQYYDISLGVRFVIVCLFPILLLFLLVRPSHLSPSPSFHSDPNVFIPPSFC